MRMGIELIVVWGIFASNGAVSAQSPLAILGRPVAAALGNPPSRSPGESTSFKPLVRASAPDPLIGDYSPAARLGDLSEVRLGNAPASDSLSSPEERFNWGIPEPLSSRSPASTRPSMSKSHFHGKLGEFFHKEGGRNWGNFESDHCFDDFISPVSNPFLAEDPRALTEIRPIFLYQTIPRNGTNYNGGNIEYFGMRGSIAFTERLSLTLNKLGGLSINPGSNSVLGGGTGFSEIWLGPKYTFYRNDQTGTIAAAGAIFQIPTGPGRVYQDTGRLSIVPYVTGAQKFGKSSYGTFTVMDTFGYSLASNRDRSDYFYNSIHLDFDVLNWQRVYPLLELNWFHYTNNGQARGTDFEGMDLANVGSAVAGRNYLNAAIGARFKYSEAIQFGIAAQFPLNGTRDLMNFRLGVDFIYRY